MITALSCKDKDPNADCGCDGSTTKVVENVKGSYLGSNSFVIRISYDNNIFYETYVSACNISDTLKITTDIKKPNYIISGNIKKECFTDLMTLTARPSQFEIKSIKSAL
ncbi:hypothetical protein [Dyadobacter sp. NIV53]|uniref:hypothetical protein n=1 Tax=Dyadobacter sp. NIV53 TaxID=2861765 RepID=UPI001C86E703|nr:hypothetical protein [Dyadobacter sp. NIV53]